MTVPVARKPLPALVGSPADVARAEQLREALLEEIKEHLLARYDESQHKKVLAIKQAFAALVLSQTDAKWFVANQDFNELRPRLSNAIVAWVRLRKPEVL